MRIIKFRAKCINNGKWVYGSLVFGTEWDKVYIYQNELIGAFWQLVKYEVDSKTVGQFTGLLDKNGKKIYEGDIVKVNLPYGSKFIVRWDKDRSSFMLVGVTKSDFAAYDKKGYKLNAGKKEIISNIYENPEFLSNKKER